MNPIGNLPQPVSGNPDWIARWQRVARPCRQPSLGASPWFCRVCGCVGMLLVM